MKVLCVLLSFFALSAAHHEDELIEQFKQFMENPLALVTDMIRENLMSEDGSSFKPEVMGMLVVVEPQICPVESKKCLPADNWLFGCTCRKGFRALGECKKKPCQLFRHFRENGPDSLGRFLSAESNEEKYRILVDYLLVPVSRALCECPGMVGATINCARKYDGQLFDLTEMERASFDNMVSHIDWKTLKNILLGFLKGGCGEKNGKDCVTELANMWTLMGTFQDNTQNGEDNCHSMMRFGEEYAEFVETMTTFDMESESLKNFLGRVVDSYLDMERVAMCEPSCAGEMRDSFYSCCAKHAWEVATSNKMKKGYQKLLKNVLTLFSEGQEFPKLGSAFNKFLSIYDPESFCGDLTDVYRERNEECEALGA